MPEAKSPPFSLAGPLGGGRQNLTGAGPRSFSALSIAQRRNPPLVPVCYSVSILWITGTKSNMAHSIGAGSQTQARLTGLV